MLRLGFVGTGTLSEAVITGLQSVSGESRGILVSPRSEETSRALALRYPNVTRSDSNQAVVDGSDIVVLGMRPQQVEAVAALRFHADQIVVSLLAGTSLDVVAARVAPARRICRAIPLPSIRSCKGPIVIFPADAAVEDLFGGLGDLIIADREADLAATGHASAMMSSFYELQNAMVNWLVGRGLAADAATLYVRSMFDGLGEVALASFRDREPLRPEDHETEGGLNACGRRFLQDAGWFEDVGRALDAIEVHRFGAST